MVEHYMSIQTASLALLSPPMWYNTSMAKKLPSVRAKKYVELVAQGLPKTKARDLAGYSPNTDTVTIDNTSAVKTISVKDALLSHISLQDITKRHASLIQSDNEAVAVNAIKLGYERIEPNGDVSDDVERITVVMKG